MTYRQRLQQITETRGRLCVGIDPMPSVLEAWGLQPTVAGLETCARGIVEELGERIAVFKPQSAFFEAHGSAGIAVLERVLADIRDAGALSILDVKRGDIGSSMAGYAAAYLSEDSPLRSDSITVSPFLGFDSLVPTISMAAEQGRGIYVLARTSNPESAPIQLADGNGATIAQQIIDAAHEANLAHGDCVGLVIGGTHSELGCDPTGFTGSILVPGIGAQGGTIEAVRATFGNAIGVALPTASREVIGGGFEALRGRADSLLDRVSALG